MLTIIITQDNKELKRFENQESDIKALGWLLRNQSNSTSHAIKYEGYKVEVINQETKESYFWKP